MKRGHACAGGCGCRIRYQVLSCVGCLSRLPPGLRGRLATALRGGRDEHAQAVEAACQWWAANPPAPAAG